MPADQSPRSATPHPTHDVVLLAAIADRDPDPATRATVERMIAACPECAAIAEDLRLLAIGLADLPPSLTAPRDMRLTEADAARLRRGGLWRSILRPFGATGLPGLRPLAGALSALGLAGLLLTTVPLGLSGGATSFDLAKGLGSAAAAPGATAAPAALGPVTASAPSDAAGGPEHVASQAPRSAETPALPITDNTSGASASGAPQTTLVPAYAPGSRSSDSGSSIPPLTLVSIVLLGSGLGLLALRLLAGRLA